MIKLTIRQQQIIDFIQQQINTTGIAPTRAEIAEHMGFQSINAAEDHLRALERKGYIQLLSNTARGIRITPTKSKQLPILSAKNLLGNNSTEPILSPNNIISYSNLNKIWTEQENEVEFILQLDIELPNLGFLPDDLLFFGKARKPDLENSGKICLVRFSNHFQLVLFSAEISKNMHLHAVLTGLLRRFH